MDTVYVSDLDGTLLGLDGRLSDPSRAGLGELLARGVPFTVASARSVVSMQGALGVLPLRLPVICFNGGFISDLATGRHHRVHALPPSLAGQVCEIVRDAGLQAIVSTHTDDGDHMYVPATHNAGVGMYVADRRAHADPRLRLVDDPDVGLTQAVTCLTVIARRAALEALYDALGAGVGAGLRLHLFDDLYTTGWSWITMHAAEADKGRAVGEVVHAAGLSEHRLVVFGDQHNDLPMFARADWAVATDNAVPEVKAAADEVIGAHHTDAVVQWLRANA